MKRLAAVATLILISGCAAGASYVAGHRAGAGEFQPSVCAKIPVGVETLQHLDPSLGHLRISCADLARCAALSGQGTPPNVPCL
ncbi:MAG: hypothetical protein ACT4NX_09610 [Deltaproteobacteria bacterium]